MEGRPALLGVCLVLAGCSGDSDTDEPIDPTSVSENFVQAVADADPQACELMTPGARRQARLTGGGKTCDESIEAQKKYVDFIFFQSRPSELTKEVDDGELVETNRGTVFRFCLPNEAEIKLDLVQVESEWRVDLVSTSRSESYGPGGNISSDEAGRAAPCRLA